MGFWAAVAEQLNPAPAEPLWAPHPKQAAAVALAGEVFEMLYGGAAGGGKSHMLRHYGVDFALTHSGAHIGLVRRTLPMLKQTHGMHLPHLLAGIAKENRTESTWTFPNGSVLRFISLLNPGDEQAFKSAEFDLLLFDEVTEILETQYTFMLTRLRSAKGHRAHCIATANPEGRGFRWVKRRWVKPEKSDLAPGQGMPQPGTPWTAPIVEDGEIVDWQPPRAFIPATIEDNPELMRTNPQYVRQLRSMPDTRLRRALLYGDWDAMDAVPGALWVHDVLDEHRVTCHPDLVRVVVGVDPSGSGADGADEAGVIVVGQAANGHLYVLRDSSGVKAPDVWAAAVGYAYDAEAADLVVAEANYGGEMVRLTLKNAHPGIPVKIVHASRGKAIRAEPIAWLTTDGRLHLVGSFPELEDELTTWTPESGWSPGRLDAMVWSCTELTGGGTGDSWMQYLRKRAEATANEDEGVTADA